ncbi:MAG: DUF4157 domain-containing protein, partial [Bacteroidota bacterium]
MPQQCKVMAPPPFSAGGGDMAPEEEAAEMMMEQSTDNMAFGDPPETPGDNPNGDENLLPNGLPRFLKDGISKLTGIDLGDVKVNYNAAEPAKFGARAFARGKEIFLGSGHEKDLAHEAWHIVQQSQGRVQPTGKMNGIGINDNPQLEQEADEMGAKAMQAGKNGEMSEAKLISSPASKIVENVAQFATDNKDQHLKFLTSQVQVPMQTGQDFWTAYTLAYILDNHLYRTHKETLEVPENIKGIYDTIQKDQPVQVYRDLFYNYLHNVTTQNYSQIQFGAHKSVDYAGANFELGTGVGAFFTTAGHAEGLATNVNTPWMEVLKHRRDGTKTMYAMGHLLNADLGGPALDYNLVPLTAGGEKYGSNNANAVHSKGIEQMTKGYLERLHRGEIIGLRYEVVANYNRAPRAQQIAILENARQQMDAIEGVLAQSNADFATTQLTRLEQEHKKQLSQQIVAVPGLDVALKAVSGLNFWTRKWSDLKTAMSRNIDLWKLEDLIVPDSLDCKVSWQDPGQIFVNEYPFPVPIQLPTSIATPFSTTISSKSRAWP